MIELNNITVKYKSGESKIPALSSLDLRIEDGDYISVLGPNGSGKSTLIRAICGLVSLSEGDVFINGEKIIYGQFGSQLFGKAAVVFQEPSGQFLMSTVRKELMSYLQNLGYGVGEQKTLFDSTADKFLEQSILDKSPEELSAGQMQLVNMACAVSHSPGILLLDEPTTFLDLKNREILLKYFRELRSENLTIIHVTQYPDEAMECPKTCLLNGGKMIAVGESESILYDENLLKSCRLTLPRSISLKKRFGVGLDEFGTIESSLKSVDNKKIPPGIPEKSRRDIIVRANDLAFSYPRSQFSIELDELCLYKDQIVGLVGPSGSGKSTLALLLSGILPIRKGSVLFRGDELNKLDTAKKRTNIGISWQMPDPVLMGPAVRDDIEMAFAALNIENGDTGELLSKVGLSGFEDRIVDSLSGGEKRKLSLAVTLAAGPEYLILDEPAAYLDPESQAELSVLLKDLSKITGGMLVIGHDLIFLSEIADRIIGLDRGRISFDLPAFGFFSDPIYARNLGIGGDPVIFIRERLIKTGADPGPVTLDPVRIFEHLKTTGQLCE